MASCRLIIAPAAKNDLRDIYQYGLQHWGQKQSENYLSAIKQQFWKLTQQPLMGRERPELWPDLRAFPVKSHTVFYRVSANAIDIIRVLHGRQDPQRHLNDPP